MESENTNPGGERRVDPDSKRRDRRVIARLGHPEMRKQFQHISGLARFWVGLSAAYTVVMLIGTLSLGKLALGRSLVYDVCVVLIGVAVYRFERSVRSYLNSESQNKLVIVVERLFLLLFTALVLGVVMGTVHLITLF